MYAINLTLLRKIIKILQLVLSLNTLTSYQVIFGFSECLKL